MKVLAVLVCVFAVAAGALGFYVVTMPAPSAPPAAASDLQALRSEVAGLGDRLTSLEQQVAKLASARSVDQAEEAAKVRDGKAPQRADLEETVRHVVAEWMAAQKPGEASAPPAGAVAGDEAAGTKLTAEEAFRRLTSAADPGQGLWEEVRAAGLIDEMVTRFEARAKAEGTPDALVDMGHAYLQKVFELGGGPKAGEWANKADAAYDKALAIDDHHWEARFSKAVNLSFWPPMFGKQPEAIRHLETLVEQQRSAPRTEDHAQTYLILGNLYSQTGDQEKATKTWQEGSELFPEDGSLKEQLSGAQQPPR